MKIFFVDSSVNGVQSFLDMDVENFLISYWYDKDCRLTDLILKQNPKARVILDSGAFSAWKKKAEISVNEYISYCKAHKDKFYAMINLDVIGNAEKSFENFKIMKKAGLDVVPVFHRVAGKLDPIEHLIYYCKNSDYVALSGYALSQAKFNDREMINYTKKMFEIIPKDKKIHLLGLTNFRVIMGIGTERIHSVDSSMVSRRSPYNSSVSYSGMVTNSKAMPYRISQQQVLDLQHYAIHRLLEMERQINEHEEMKQCLSK